MFSAFLVVGVTGLVTYVLWRAASVPWISRRVSRRALALLGAALALLFLLGRTLGHGGAGPLAGALERVAMDLMGSLLLFAVALGLVDAVTAFGRFLPGIAPALRGAALVAGTLLSAVASIQAHRAPAITSYEVTLPGLPRALDGVVAVVLSDTHLGPQLDEAWFDERIAQAQALHPDLVLFVGDTFEGHGDVPRDLPALRALSAPLGKWFVHGNHETHGSAAAWDALLERAGVRRLANQWVEAAPGLVLAGVEDAGRWHARSDDDALRRALADRPAGATVLLSHKPLNAEGAARAGVQLMLSGHTHGGQLWPFGLPVRLVYPLLAGRYDVGGMTVIVGRGAGTWGPRMRLWSRGEILRVTLRAPP